MTRARHRQETFSQAERKVSDARVAGCVIRSQMGDNGELTDDNNDDRFIVRRWQQLLLKSSGPPFTWNNSSNDTQVLLGSSSMNDSSNKPIWEDKSALKRSHIVGNKTARRVFKPPAEWVLGCTCMRGSCCLTARQQLKVISAWILHKNHSVYAV